MTMLMELKYLTTKKMSLPLKYLVQDFTKKIKLNYKKTFNKRQSFFDIGTNNGF